MAEQLREDNMKVVKSVHYGVIAVSILAIVIFTVLAYDYIKYDLRKNSEPFYYTDYETKNDQAPAKPLPDFIVDKLEPNELEQLKP